MSFSDWMKSRYVTPVIEAAEAKACAETEAKWRTWYERELAAAERDGRKFTEPPPGGWR